jgi:hypothetical protein
LAYFQQDLSVNALNTLQQLVKGDNTVLSNGVKQYLLNLINTPNESLAADAVDQFIIDIRKIIDQHASKAMKQKNSCSNTYCSCSFYSWYRTGSWS